MEVLSRQIATSIGGASRSPNDEERRTFGVAVFPETLVPGPFRFQVSAFVALLQVVVGGIFIAAAGGANLVLQNEALSTILAQIGSVLVAILIEPFSVAMFVVLYYELMARTEGFDLLQRAQQTVAAP